MSFSHVNIKDTHTFDWSLTNNNLVDTNLDADDTTYIFDPSGLVPDFYKVVVEVTDSGVSSETAQIEILLEVINAAPNLTSVDSDGDGINDDVESYGDSDSDGIADYKDNDTLASHELQAYDNNTGNYIIRTDAGLSLRLGSVAFAAAADGADVTLDEIANFGGDEATAGPNPNDGVPNTGGYFDYEIWGLTQAGQSANLVIPQINPIPNGAIYRKYFSESGWSVFTTDANNNLASAPGSPGVCPLPGDDAFTPGLTEGHYCIQLTIEDGGPNDTDRLQNYVIKDPGTLSTPLTEDNTPVAGNSQSGGGQLSFYFILILLMGTYLKLRQGYRF